ncbi:MAG: hypothetical protein OES12_08375 [Anaerolineae bacterium]|nr:hypothetical protein [Anaerolineae bacterium]
MRYLQPSIHSCFQTNDQLNPEAEAILVLIETLVGDLSQPITVVSGLSELLLSANDQNRQLEKDLMTILKQTDRMKETIDAVKYVTNYGATALRRSYLI